MRVALFLIFTAHLLAAQDLKRETHWGFLFAASNNGVLTVKGLNSDSPAARAGLKDNDVLISCNGNPLNNSQDAQIVNRLIRAGDPVKLIVSRAGKRMPISFVAKGKPLESLPGTDVTYGAVKSESGYLIRTITTLPKNRTSKVPGVFFVNWLSCGGVELDFSSMDGWSFLSQDFATKSGMAYMRVDRPGLGDSQGPPCSRCDLQQDLNAFEAAFKAFKLNPNVDSTNIFVFGASIGGALAPVLMQNENPRGIIVANTFSRSWFEHFMDFERTRLQLSGQPFSAVTQKMKLYAEFYFDYLIGKMTPKQVMEKKPHLKDIWYDQPESQFGRPSVYHHQVQDLDVPAAWQKMKCPVLVIYGELDWIMSKQEHEYIVNVVNSMHPGNAELKIIKGMDHHFSVYSTLRESFDASTINYSEEVFPAIAQWIGKQTKR